MKSFLKKLLTIAHVAIPIGATADEHHAAHGGQVTKAAIILQDNNGKNHKTKLQGEKAEQLFISSNMYNPNDNNIATSNHSDINRLEVTFTQKDSRGQESKISSSYNGAEAQKFFTAIAPTINNAVQNSSKWKYNKLEQAEIKDSKGSIPSGGDRIVSAEPQHEKDSINRA